MKTVLINREDRPERLRDSVNHLSSFGLEPEVFPAILGGWRGCRDSHLAVLSKYRSEEHIFILEDDVLFLSDPIKAHFHEYDVIHASPPCQAYSMASMQFRKAGKKYVDLIEVTRRELIKTGKPYVIENVPGSPLINPIELCGSMFGMRTYRHRLFESNIELKAPPHPEHAAPNAKMGRKPKDGEFIQYVGHFSGVGLVQEMTGLYWLGQGDLAQSIPPQYTKYIGEQLMVALSYACR